VTRPGRGSPLLNRRRALQLVLAVAAPKRLPVTPYDPRTALWDAARAEATPRAPAPRLMEVACWLYYARRVRDVALVCAALKLISRAANPYPYLQPGGRVLEALIGRLAGERAATEKAAHQAEDEAFFNGT
jgi:hypothetical protein